MDFDALINEGCGFIAELDQSTEKLIDAMSQDTELMVQMARIGEALTSGVPLNQLDERIVRSLAETKCVEIMNAALGRMRDRAK